VRNSAEASICEIQQDIQGQLEQQEEKRFHKEQPLREIIAM